MRKFYLDQNPSPKYDQNEEKWVNPLKIDPEE